MADHGDHLTNRYGLSIDAPHNEITDFFVYRKGPDLIFSSAFDPSFPKGQNSVDWPENFRWRVNIDLDSKVSYSRDPELNAVAGGYISEPDRIDANVKLEVTFDRRNKPRLKILGDRGRLNPADVDLFAGVRAEQFPFAPLVRRNRPTISLRVNRKALFGDDRDPTLLAWAQSIIDQGDTYRDSTDALMKADDGPYIDSAGRALRSQFPVDQRVINALHPSKHVAQGFEYPDVVIYDTSKPATIPNGRSLDDDVLTYLSGLSNTTPGPAADANTGVQTAVDAEINNSPVDGIPYAPPGGATAADTRTWNRFPYNGLPYNINNDVANSEPVHRFYDKLTGSYYYTSGAKDIRRWQERKGVVSQGEVFSSASQGQAVYRFLNVEDRSRFWTASRDEYLNLKANNRYVYEGETFFVQAPGSLTPGAVEVHRLYSPENRRYFWGSDASEINDFLSRGYRDEGVAWTI